MADIEEIEVWLAVHEDVEGAFIKAAKRFSISRMEARRIYFSMSEEKIAQLKRRNRSERSRKLFQLDEKLEIYTNKVLRKAKKEKLVPYHAFLPIIPLSKYTVYPLLDEIIKHNPNVLDFYIGGNNARIKHVRWKGDF